MGSCGFLRRHGMEIWIEKFVWGQEFTHFNVIVWAWNNTSFKPSQSMTCLSVYGSVIHYFAHVCVSESDSDRHWKENYWKNSTDFFVIFNVVGDSHCKAMQCFFFKLDCRKERNSRLSIFREILENIYFVIFCCTAMHQKLPCKRMFLSLLVYILIFCILVP